MRSSFSVSGLIAVVALSTACGAADANPLGAAKRAAKSTVASADALGGYDRALAAYVDADGWVDYRALNEDRAGLDAYVAALATADLSEGDDATRLARLINAYNAFTLQLILDGGRGGGALPATIQDLEDGKPWDAVRWELGGETVSLNQIEHERIRPVFDEPRIHWALVCAAYSCPPLRNGAYTAGGLEAELAEREAYVLNFDHPRYVRGDGDGVRVTPLFDWYGGDFGADWRAYAGPRLGVKTEAFGGFLEYDWRLNDVANRP